jgi:hypothetical protein
LFAILEAQAAKTVATIGDKAVVIDSSTSCDLKKWASNQTNACGCCLTKEKITTKDTADEVIRYCIKDKDCTLKTIGDWAPGETNSEDILTQVIWSTVDTPTITVDPKFLDKNGKLKVENLVDFLGTLQKDLRDLKEPLYSDFSKSKCISAKNLGTGGVNTAQLFMISVNESCMRGDAVGGTFEPKYIIKETKKKTVEIRNLRQLHLSELYTSYNLLSPKRPKNKMAISFDALNIKYIANKSSHYLTFLAIAPGKSLMNLSKDLASSISLGNTAEEHTRSDILYNSFYAVGKDLGELHRHFMEQGDDKKKLLRKSVVQGDLHLNNVYVKPPQNIQDLVSYIVTLIDNETFALSLKEKRPVGIDLFVLYAFSVSQFKSDYAYPKEISLTKWNNIMLKPLLLGYISNWPADQRAQLIGELRDIFTNFISIIKLLPQRSLFINPLSYRAKIKDINRIFDEISKPYKVRKA